jgi:hypothetical protein
MIFCQFYKNFFFIPYISICRGHQTQRTPRHVETPQNQEDRRKSKSVRRSGEEMGLENKLDIVEDSTPA